MAPAMKVGDVVELLAEQHIPPAPAVPKGILGEVISTPPAQWNFAFPRYNGPLRLADVRVVTGPRAWSYRARRYWAARVHPRLPNGTAALAIAVVGPVVGTAIGGEVGAVTGGVAGLLAGALVTVTWRLVRHRQ